MSISGNSHSSLPGEQIKGSKSNPLHSGPRFKLHHALAHYLRVLAEMDENNQTNGNDYYHIRNKGSPSQHPNRSTI